MAVGNVKLSNFRCGFFVNIRLKSVFNGRSGDLREFSGYVPRTLSGAAANDRYK